MLNHGVSTGGLFMIVGMLSDRRHTRLISEFGGLKAVMPRLVAAFLLITLASIALPLTNGFIGEFLILLGAFRWNPPLAGVRRDRRDPVGGLHALDVPARELRPGHATRRTAALPDLTPREWALMVPIVAMAIFMGVLPGLFLRPMEPSVNRVIERVTGRSRRRCTATAPATPDGRVR